MRALVLVCLSALGSALVSKPKTKKALAPETESLKIESLDQIRTYWHSEQNPGEHSTPDIFDITSTRQMQKASDAGVFGIENGQVTLQQGGTTFKGSLAKDCKSIAWSDGDRWILEGTIPKVSPCWKEGMPTELEAQIEGGSSITVDGVDKSGAMPSGAIVVEK